MNLGPLREQFFDIVMVHFRDRIEGHETSAEVSEDKKDSYYNSSVLKITEKLFQNKIEETIPYLESLIEIFPFKYSLYYYFLKMRFTVMF